MPDADTQSENGKRTRAEIAAQTREAILNAACEVIAEIGLENIRMRMVAERAGVSTAALHYHFDTREKLFAAALHYSFGSTGADVYERKGDGDTATARLARIINASLPMTPSLRREWALCRSCGAVPAATGSRERWPSTSTRRTPAGSRRRSATASLR